MLRVCCVSLVGAGRRCGAVPTDRQTIEKMIEHRIGQPSTRTRRPHRHCLYQAKANCVYFFFLLRCSADTYSTSVAAAADGVLSRSLADGERPSMDKGVKALSFILVGQSPHSGRVRFGCRWRRQTRAKKDRHAKKGHRRTAQRGRPVPTSSCARVDGGGER